MAKTKLGRPKKTAEKKFDHRHVVNVSAEMEAAVLAYMAETGVSAIPEAMRVLLTKALRTEGKL